MDLWGVDPGLETGPAGGPLKPPGAADKLGQECETAQEWLRCPLLDESQPRARTPDHPFTRSLFVE